MTITMPLRGKTKQNEKRQKSLNLIRFLIIFKSEFLAKVRPPVVGREWPKIPSS